MGKKFTTKKLKLRSRAEKRRFRLKTNPKTKGVKITPEKINEPVIRSLDQKVRAIQEKQNTQA